MLDLANKHIETKINNRTFKLYATVTNICPNPRS